jgi:S-DNA-T family DNA segregation ATPase FtsK/SpoIIIE
LGRKKARNSRKSRGGGRWSELTSSFLFGEPLDGATGARVRELSGILMIGLSIWLLISMFSFHTPHGGEGNIGGVVGYYLANAVFVSIGLAGYILCLLGICWGGIVVARKEVSLPAMRIIGATCFLVTLALILDLGFGAPFEERGELTRLSNDLPYGPGGWAAYEAVPNLYEKFGWGLWVLLGSMGLVSFMLATEMAFYPAVMAFGAWAGERRERWGQQLFPAIWGWFKELCAGLWAFLRGADLAEPAAPQKAAARPRARRKAVEVDEDEEDDEGDEEVDEDEDDEEDDEDEDEDDEEEWEYEDDEEEDELELVPASRAKKKDISKVAARAAAAARQSTFAERSFSPPTPPPGPWTLPPLELLQPPTGGQGLDRQFLEDSARDLENALKSFRVEAEVIGAQVGPAVTMFELTVAQGTRMNKVTQLSQEVAATLRARSVRIIAPIPGKSTIGIEVPNKSRRTVRISELISQKAYDKDFMALPLFLGMDAEGSPIVADLARMPHLLIAGTTGSGKSVCINTIVASFLLTRSPHDVRLILVDPKMVELQMFQAVPHLELPVVTDMKHATNVLLWAVEKMEGRYELFKDAGVKNIKTFNGLGEDALRERMGENFNEERTPRHVPYIVVIIDEMADLMMQSKKEAELAITRLAQKSRAVGIHVIVATQRPSTDVITGVIKGNLPTRIAFQVASKVDSRVILDAMGAEKLLGQGDMLYTPPQSSQLKRVQGALVEDSELQALVDFVTKEAPQTFNQELIQSASGSALPGEASQGGERIDEMFNEAVTVVLKSRRGSASLLQRALGIGYTRASRLIDQMTDAGIVGEHRGSKSREILMTLDDWEENLQNIEEAGA